MQTTDDIAATVIKSVNGTPVRVRDLAIVMQAPKIRLGQLGKTIRKEDGHVIDDDDVVEGIVLLRKGAEADATLDALHAKINELNNGNSCPKASNSFPTSTAAISSITPPTPFCAISPMA